MKSFGVYAVNFSTLSSQHLLSHQMSKVYFLADL